MKYRIVDRWETVNGISEGGWVVEANNVGTESIHHDGFDFGSLQAVVSEIDKPKGHET